MHINSRKIQVNKSIYENRIIKLIVIFVLILSIFLRFVNLNQKFYWVDEVHTAVRMSGYTKAEITEQLFTNKFIQVSSLEKYKFPNAEKNLGDAFAALVKHPEHPPLYYILVRLWTQLGQQWFGESVALIRSLSVLISLLTFPAVYWLSLELFNSSLVGSIAMAIVAVSPLHFLYAQEARQYSLWTAIILLSSLALIRAIRLNNRISWSFYAFSLCIGLYSHLLFTLTLVSHGIYLLIIDKFNWSKKLIAYSQASLAAVIAFTPWLVVMFINLSQISSTITKVETRTPLSSLIGKWFRNINYVFFNVDLGAANLILVIFVIYSLYILCSHTPQQVWLLLLTLIGFTALSLMIPDLLLGGVRSVRIRYLIPCYLGIQLTVSYLCASQIASRQKWRRRVGKLSLLLIITAGIIASIVNSQAEAGWSKSDKAQDYPKIFQAINQSANPLIISDASSTYVLTLSYGIKNQAWLQLKREPEISQNTENFSNIFLFNPSEPLRQVYGEQEDISLEAVVEKKNLQLWKILK